MFKKKHDLHYPYTYGETSSLDVFAWFKVLSITTFALFFLTVFYNDIMKLLPFHFIRKYAIELVILPGIIYLLLNIAGLEWASKDNWKLLFKKITWKDVFLVLGSTIAALFLSLTLGSIFGGSAPTNSAASTSHDLLGFVVNQFDTIFENMGEEFLAIVPFLAFISLGKYLKWNHTLVTILAIILSSILFGMAHAWTYGGLLAGIQATFIGRIIFTLTFVKTKNIWVSYFTHYLYDFSLFALIFVAASTKLG